MIRKHKFVHIEKMCLLLLLIFAILIAAMPMASAYNSGDVNVINNINGLNLGSDPSKWDADIVKWSGDSSPRIIELNISGKGLAGNLNLAGLDKLEYLDCSDNQLTNLDVTKNLELLFLFCNNNQLATLDVTKNVELRALLCSNNELKILNVEQNKELVILSCYENQLSSLNLVKNTELETLFCGNNSLTSLDVTGLIKLTELYCNDNQLVSLDVAKNTKLTELICSNNELTSLDVSKLTDLTLLYCNNNQLKNLNLATNTKLTELICSSNELISLDATKSVGLTELICSNNSLTNLDVTGLASLTVLYCNDNQLKSLNLATNKKLAELICGDNLLENLNLEQNTELTLLYCNNNQLKILDLTKNKGLAELICSNNVLESLDITGLANLTLLYCNDNQLKSLNLVTNTKLTYLICSSNLLESLNLEQNIELIELYCNDNQLTVLDVTKNTKLIGLICSNNQLTNLDLNAELIGLICSNNQLTSLNLATNTKLKGLDCSNNQLAGLAVTMNTELEELYAEDQLITLTSDISKKGQLTISNPIQYNGNLVTTITGADINDNEIVLSGLAGTSNDAEFTFSQSTGKSGDFSGKVIQPWVAGYTIILDANGGVDSGELEVIYGNEVGTLPTPKRTGYTFDGWFDEEENGNKYTDATKYEKTDDITLYAQWAANKYTITFNANGGAVDSDDEELEVFYDQKVGVLPTPIRTGYTFDGWFDEEENGNKYTFDTEYEVDDNIILYAQWTANTYTIIFDANGGDVDPESQSATFNSVIGTLPTPIRTGYSFEGWVDNMAGGTKYADSTKYEIDDDIVLHAEWEANTYTIFFDNNGDTTGIESIEVTYDREVGTLPIPILSGYSFIGWFDASSGGTEYTDKTEYKVDGDTTLHSRWSRVDREGTGRAVIVDGITETPTREEIQDPSQNNAIEQGGQGTQTPGGNQNESEDSSIPGFGIIFAIAAVVGLTGLGIYRRQKEQ